MSNKNYANDIIPADLSNYLNSDEKIENTNTRNITEKRAQKELQKRAYTPTHAEIRNFEWEVSETLNSCENPEDLDGPTFFK